MSFDSEKVVSARIDMYSKNENICDAHKVFDTMAIGNVVSWNTMIVGDGQHGEGREAIELFRKMLQDDFSPNDLTLASIVRDNFLIKYLKKIEVVLLF